jgi:hypothetical protein
MGTGPLSLGLLREEKDLIAAHSVSISRLNLKNN